MTLVTYQQVWTHKTCEGWQYVYRCTWSDGNETIEHTLPWGRMDGVVELPATSLLKERLAANSTLPDQTR